MNRTISSLKDQNRLYDLEAGCANLKARLQSSIVAMQHRLDHIAMITKKITSQVSATINTVTIEFQNNPDLIEQTNTPFTDYSKLLEAMESVGTPETRTYVSILRQHRQPLEKEVASRQAQSRSPRLMRRAILRDIGDQDTGKVFFIALIQFLESDKSAMIQPETRTRLIVTLKRAQFKGNSMDLIQTRLDGIYASFDPVDRLATEVDGLLRMFKKCSTSLGAFKATESALAELETRNDNVTLGSSTSQESNKTEKIKKLETELVAFEHQLMVNTETIKAHFTERPDLVRAIPAVLRSLRLICADLVKTEINEITTWEIGIALRQWQVVRHQLGKDSPLKAIDAHLVTAALEYLNDHDDFLVAYNTAKSCKTRMAESIGIIEAHRISAKKPDDEAGRSQPRKKEELERLRKSLSIARAESHSATEELAAGLDDLARRTGIAAENIEEAEFWDNIEKSICNKIFETLELEIIECEQQLNNLIE